MQIALGEESSKPFACVSNFAFGGKECEDIASPFAEQFIDSIAEAAQEGCIVVDVVTD